MIGINTLTAVEQIAYANHVQFFYRLGKNHPEDVFAINTPRRMAIDRMRNISAKMALEHEFDYLMFIDDDVIIPLNAYDQLKALDVDIAAAWVIIRGYPFENMFFKRDPKDNSLHNYEVERGPGVYDVDAVGFSCCLIKCSLLKKVNPPWFVTGPFNTEDIYFCMKARQQFPETTIVVDAGLECAHIMGPECIAPWNHETYTKYYKDTFPELAQDQSAPLADSAGGERANNFRKFIQTLPEQPVEVKNGKS